MIPHIQFSRFRYKVISLTFYIFSFFSFLSAAGPSVLWTRTYGGDSSDVGQSVQQTSDGGFIVAGWSNSCINGDNGVFLIRTDSIGDTLWTKRYGDEDHEYGCSVLETNDKGFIIAGYRGGVTYDVSSGVIDSPAIDGYLVRTNSQGDLLWTKTFGGSIVDIFNSIVPIGNEGFLLAGHSGIVRTPVNNKIMNIWIVRTDSDGETLWSRTYGGNEDETGVSAAVTRDGGFIIVSNRTSFVAGLKNSDAYFFKIDKKGDTLWTKTYGGLQSDFVQQTSDGEYLIVGSTLSSGANQSDIYLLKTDMNGNTIWIKTFGGTGNDQCRCIRQTSDSGLIIVGMTNSFSSSSYKKYIIRTNSNGDTMWTGTYDIIGYESSTSIAQTFDGGFVITGYINGYLGSGKEDVFLTRFGKETSSATLEGRKPSINLKTFDFNALYNSEKKKISIQLASPYYGLMDIKLFNMQGKLMYKSQNELKNQEYINLTLAKNSEGNRVVQCGIYLLKITINRRSVVHNILISNHTM